MFDWFRWAGLGECVNILRQYSEDGCSRLPSWVVFSLPDSLWVFSQTFIWGRSVDRPVRDAARFGLAIGRDYSRCLR